jgi:hypothetical protein
LSTYTNIFCNIKNSAYVTTPAGVSQVIIARVPANTTISCSAYAYDHAYKYFAVLKLVGVN